MNLETFFNPRSIAVIGASLNTKKLGSVILQNIIESKFDGEILAVNPKNDGEMILGKKCLGNLADFPTPIDLAVIVIPGKFVEGVIDDLILNKTQNVIIISAGFGEIGNHKLEDDIAKKCKENNINLLGPNCLGAILPYSHCNASFSDGFPRQGNICFVSQSGAFCTAILDWANKKKIGFSHFISLGNKAGISETDILENLMNDDSVEIFAFYLESVANGKKFLEQIRKISSKKPVIILEPGRSEKAAAASSSHTGALAPNARVLSAAYKAAGAIQVDSMREMAHILEILTFSKNKNLGKNIAILTNAGGFGVMTTDLTDDNDLILVEISKNTQEKLSKVLPEEAALGNPIDIIGDADAQRYEESLEILCKNPDIDQILVLLTPQRTTEIKETAQIIAKFAKKTDKNIVGCFIGGSKVASGIKILEKEQIPVFNFPADITNSLGKIANRNNNLIRCNTNFEKRNPQIETFIKNAQQNKLKSLPQNQVDEILDIYELIRPASQNFNLDEFENAKDFFNNLSTVVLKISSPDALHKTELKGVFLNINTLEKLKDAWNNLKKSIEISKLKNANIQVQEQITDESIEIFVGVNSDNNFGKVMVFGSGGIFTEIFNDTALRVLPVYNQKCFKNMINETKTGKILSGTRGKSYAKDKILDILKKIEKLITDFPEIIAIDANPILVSKDRAICVDFKIMI